MRIVFMGTPDFAVPSLRALVGQHDICAVYCQPPRPAGRGRKSRPSPVQQVAQALGLTVRHPATLREDQAQREFAALEADLAVVVAYGLILPPPVLEAPRHGCLNIHASLLPRWRGAAPIHRAVMAGDAETGICIMQMDEGLDTGPVLLRQATPIGKGETTGDLHDRLADMGARLIVQALERLPDLRPQPQPAEGVTHAAKIDKNEARIDWTQPAAAVARQVNGLSPFPGAWCDTPGGRLKLLRARAVAGQGAPGSVLDGTPGPALRIACGSGAVIVSEAQREGRRPMPADELLRGIALPAGTHLGRAGG